MILFVLSCIAIVILVLPVIFDDEDLPKKYLKTAVIIAAVCGGMASIIPNKETMITMLAVSYITPDNIQIVQGDIVEFIRQISEAVQNGK
jgi:MFS-type transporter involved in bile tolerance (Atg22 family)